MPNLKEVVVVFPADAAIQVQRSANGVVFRSTEDFTVYSHPEVDTAGSGATYTGSKTLTKTEILAALTNP